MTNLEDEDSFEALAMVDNESTDMEEFVFDFSTYTGEGRYIAFKNVGGSSRNPYCSNYIDDIVLSYIPENEVIYCGIDGLPWEETFDEFVVNAGTSGVEPNCWEVVGDRSNLDLSTKPQIYHGFSHSGDYSLRMRNRCVYAMPALLLDAQDVTLSLYLRQPKAVYSLQVGVVDEQGNFTTIEELNNESTDIEFREVVLGDLASGTRVAFRNVLNGRHYKYSYNYLDNVKLTGVMTPAKSVSDMTDDATSYLESIVVYPNPTTGVLHIDAMDVQKVECYNTMGQLVGVYDNARDINMGSLSEGVYTLRITVPQGVTMRKVVKR